MAQIGDLPNLVTVHDAIQAGGALHIVASHLAGGSLEARFDGEPLSPTSLLRLAIYLARALEQLHVRDITHGDLTPSNVLLDEQGVAHVADFGLSSLVDVGAADSPTSARFSGTLPYMAPERAWGGAPSKSADLYAFGCILYEAATGTAPHAGLHATDQLAHKAESLPPRISELNPQIPEALSDLIMATLAPDPDARPSNAGDIRAALEGFSRASILVSPRAATGGALPSEPFVGRRDEIALIQEAARRSRENEPGVFLLTGDAGVGKSTLLRMVVDEVESAGGAAILGRTRPENPAAFQPFLDALLPLAPRIPELPTSEAQALRRFLRLGEKDEGASYGTNRDRRSVFIGVLRALEHLARDRVLGVLIDDFEAADPDSVDLFEFLTRSLHLKRERPTKLLLAVAFREPPKHSALAAALGRLATDPGTRPHHITPFDERTTYDFLTTLNIPNPSSALTTHIHQATQGNPLFILQAVDSLRRQDALETKSGTTTTKSTAQHIELPKTLTQAIDDRTRTVTQPCRRLLTIASFIGDHFDLTRLTAVAGTKEDALLTLIEEAIDHDLLTEEVEGFRFTHPLIRQALYRRSSHARRRRIHNQIAQRLEQIHATDLQRATPDIAHHLVRAGAAADPEHTLKYAAAAAQQAVQAYAWNEAAELYSAAIDAAHKAGRLSTAAQAELHRRAAEVHRHSSDSGLSLEQYDEAIAKFEEANDHYGKAEALEGKVSTQVALGGLTYGQEHETNQLEEALSQLDPNEHHLKAKLLGTLAVAHWATQQPEKAAERATEAIRLAEQQNDKRLASDIRCQLAMSELQQTRPKSALKTWESALVDSREAGDPVREEAALQRIPLVLQLLGRLEEAERTVEEADTLNRLVHSQANLSLTLANKTQLAALQANTDEAAKHATDCTQLVQRASYGWSGLLALPALAAAHALKANRDEAKQAINDILKPGFLFDDPALFAESMTRYHTLIDAYAGDDLEVNTDQKHVTDLSPFAPGPSGPDFAFMTPLCVEVEIAWFTGAESISPAASEALELAHRRGMVFTTAWPFLIPRVRGMAAALEGRWDDAECYLRSAIEIADEQHVVPEQARSRLDYSYLLLSNEAHPRPDAAAEFLKQAAGMFERAGMHGFGRRATRLADSAGIAL